MPRTIKASTGHTMQIQKITAGALPPNCLHSADYDEFWVVRNWDADGVVFFYLGKGNPGARQQVVAWYPNGRMWGSYGDTLAAAVEGAIKDGWMYAA